MRFDQSRAGSVVSSRFAVAVKVAVACALVAIGAGRAAAQPTSGLVAHWSFDEGAGVDVHDSSPNSNHGQLINGAVAWTAGHTGGGLNFDGTSRTEMRIPASNSMGQFTGMTFAAWVNNAEPGRDGPIIAKEGGGLLSYWFGCIGGRFGMLASPNGSNWPTIEASRQIGSVPANVWIHLAVTWDGALMRMYENGLLVGTYPYAQAIADTSPYTSIGVNSTFNNTQFHGTLDDVYMYNRALSADEVGQVMRNGASPCNTAFQDLFAPFSPQWSNYSGNWANTGDGYRPLSPDNDPITCTALPYDLVDYDLTVDIHNLTDGGVWVRTDGTNQNGLLLITGGWGYGQGVRGGNCGAVLYFHRIVNGSASEPLALTAPIFTPGTDHSIRVAVSGPVYAVYVDGAAAPATVLVDTTFSHGRVGLYSDQPNTTAGGFGPPQTVTGLVLSGIGPTAARAYPVSVCPGGVASPFLIIDGSADFTYQWQWQPAGAGTDWVNLANGDNAEAGGVPVLNVNGVTTGAIEARPLIGYINFPPRAVRCVLNSPCGGLTSNSAQIFIDPADLGRAGGLPGRDGVHDNNDFIAFINLFFTGNPAADLGSPGGVLGSDGQFNNNDFISFINLFFVHC
ncbi:MAG: LamG domain-containing protein [Phycisphaerales bacterium]